MDTTLDFLGQTPSFSTSFELGSGAVPASSTATGGIPDFASLSGLPVQLAQIPQPVPGTPAAEFRANIEVALNQHLPQLIALAESVVNGIDRAYEPDVNPNKTASDYTTLADLTAQFYEFLNETGIGALPIVPRPSTDTDNMNIDVALPAAATMPEDQLRTMLNNAVNERYQQQRKVAENAATVMSRLAKPATY